MKLLLVNDKNEVVGTLDDVDHYDLTKPLARDNVVNLVQDMILAEKSRIKG